MKNCVKCNKSMDDEARFCPRCGEDQSVIVDNNKSPTNVNTQSPEEFIEKLHKAILAGIGLTGISVLLPMLRIVGLRGFTEFTIMDYSKFLALVIIALCVYMGNELSKKNYFVPNLASQGLFIYFVVVYLRYADSISKVRNNYSVEVSNFIHLDWGTYIFVVGVGMTFVASIVATLTTDNIALCKDSFVKQWKTYLLNNVEIHSVSVSGYIWVIAVAVILLFITSQVHSLW